MKTLKTLAVLALAISTAPLPSPAQPKDPPRAGVPAPPPMQKRVEVHVDEVHEAPFAIAHSFAGEEGSLKRAYAFSGEAVEQPLVITTTSLDDAEVAQIEEDLTIMARILEKSAQRALGGEDSPERKAMGIHLWALGGANRGARNLYIDGHGAVFLLAANIPLTGPVKQPSEEKEKKEPGNSAWESTRNEIFGGDEAGQRKRKERPGVAFDANKIDSLKKSLTETLKNASNIRGLKDDETVTIVVQGPTGRAGEGPLSFGAGGGGFGGGGGSARVQRSPREMDVLTLGETLRRRPGPRTLLTLRAKKSDINAYANGKIDTDEFRKKVSISNYQSSAEANQKQ